MDIELISISNMLDFLVTSIMAELDNSISFLSAG